MGTNFFIWTYKLSLCFNDLIIINYKDESVLFQTIRIGHYFFDHPVTQMIIKTIILFFNYLVGSQVVKARD
jgi:hypothetical protein